MPKKEKKTSTRRSAPMIKCKNCDMPVQGDLEKCPYCEAPLKRTLPKKGLLIGGIVGGTVVIVSLIAIASFAKKHDSIDPALLGSKDRLTLFDDGSEFESETSESEASSRLQTRLLFMYKSRSRLKQVVKLIRKMRSRIAKQLLLMEINIKL